ncbi:hypothetical protein LTR51_000852 [Lithohypha guttulata]|nr:hypothetical protein LTR51_000852 [Lithohypha guttulata]
MATQNGNAMANSSTNSDDPPVSKEVPGKARNTSPLLADSGSSASSGGDSETFSLDDTMRDFPVHFDRTYHKYKAGSYPFPNDAQEVERMNEQFCLIRAAHEGKMFMADIKEPGNILDIGTGSGIWAISVADNIFPDAQITGIDLSPIQPHIVPPGVRFEQQDCSELDWCRPADSFDFIFSQCLMGSLKDYQQLLITARKYLVPGEGWMECCEVDNIPSCDDGTMPEDWPLKRWSEWMVYATEQGERPLRIAPFVKRWMIESGYVDVQEVVVKIPLGGWPALPRLKKLGKRFHTLVHDSLPAASYKTFNEVMKWDRAKIELFLASVREIYGRRPSADEERQMGRMAPPPPPSQRKAKT